MAGVNITKVYLLDVPLENDYKNTLYFASKQAQQTYFQSRIKKSETNFSYQRKDQKIRWPAHIDTLYGCNYVMYQNSYYSNKWFYAFITKMEYIDDGRTDIYIETDCIQTWYFDFTVKPSFIEREHVSDDTIGLHTVPEGLELGEYVRQGSFSDYNLEELGYMIQVTEWVGGGDDKPLVTNFGGVYAPGGAYIAKSMSDVANIIQSYQDGRESAVVNVYVIPLAICERDDTLKFPGQKTPKKYTYNLSKPNVLAGNYAPTNKKLLTYPYRYLVLDNNNGTSNVLQYENFDGENDQCSFEIAGVPTVGGSIKCCPTHYKGSYGANEMEGVICGKFPTCGWTNDTYTNWLTQNAVNIGLGVVSSGLQIVGGIGMMATGAGAPAGAGMVLSGSMGIAQSMGQVYEHSILPNSAKGNTNGGDLNTCNNTNKFYFYEMSIKKEYAQIIDKYFNMFGYKVNMVKIPNQNHRERYWYTKTIDVNIDGGVPNEDMQIIKNAYNNGITFWRNASEIQNYGLSNNII